MKKYFIAMMAAMLLSMTADAQGYNQEKVLRFFKSWTPKVVKP